VESWGERRWNPNTVNGCAADCSPALLPLHSCGFDYCLPIKKRRTLLMTLVAIKLQKILIKAINSNFDSIEKIKTV
jgi:hypothetical protein